MPPVDMLVAFFILTAYINVHPFITYASQTLSEYYRLWIQPNSVSMFCPCKSYMEDRIWGAETLINDTVCLNVIGTNKLEGS